MKMIGDVLGTRWLAVALLCASLIIAPGLSSAATSGPVQQLDQPPMDSPSRGEILWYDDLESGAPGWTHGDFTTVPPKFHTDTYMAYAGTYSWWCGNFDYDTDGGYGNSWDQKLVIPDIALSEFSNYPVLTYCYRADSEAGYDYTYVQVEQSGVSTTLATYNGQVAWTDIASDPFPLASADDPLQIRFWFISDGGWSDEDGLYLSVGGGFMCDNIKIYDYGTGAPIFLDTAEPGSADSCIPTGPPVGGDHWHLGTSLCHASSGEHYWACTLVDTPGFVPAGVSNWVMTPMIDISSVTPEMGLRFTYGEQFFVPGSMGDSWKEEYTVDGGATWHLDGHWVGDQYDDYGRGPCYMGRYSTDMSALLPGTQAAFRWTMITDPYGCGPDAIGLAGIMLDDFRFETTAFVPQVWRVPDVIPTIQQAVNMATGEDTVYVAPGTYAETVAIPPEFGGCFLIGESGSKASVLVTGGMTLADGLTGATIQGLHLQGVGANSSIIRSLGTVTDLTLDGCVIDGQNVSGRLGYSGGQLEGDLTIVNCEMKDVLGWALFDSKSGSGGDGSALGTITFADNYVHNCNGSIAFRGLSTDRTDVANAYGNTFEDIGGNSGEQGQHWAALEINRAIEANVYDNIVDGVLEGEWGEGQAFQFWNVDALNCHHNMITNNFQGIYIYGGSGVHAIPGGAVSYNNISGNSDYGISVDPTATGGPLNAEMNWWSDASGPATSKGTGDKALGSIDYDPWIGKDPGGENIVCVPDPLDLVVGSTTGSIDVDYLGGGGGLLYGYSVTVTWDITKASLTSITEGNLLSDAGTTYCFVTGAGGTRTIDCTLTGGSAGVTGPGTLLTLAFSAVGSGTSTVDLGLVAFRDSGNNPLSGFYEDDGLINVDVTSPVVSYVSLANLTLPHTDQYVKDGDDMLLTAGVSDDYLVSGGDIVADLSGLIVGGGTAVVAESFTTGTAYWPTAVDGATYLSDGLRSVTVTATDWLGNTASNSDDIIVDNTPPGTVSGLDAAPAHEEVVLSWSDASGEDTNYYGVMVRYDVWGNYPLYDLPDPAPYPGNEIEGVLAFSGVGTGTTFGGGATTVSWMRPTSASWEGTTVLLLRAGCRATRSATWVRRTTTAA
jgi:hypothetical protein